MHGVAVSAGYAPWVAGLATAAVTAPLNYIGGRVTLVRPRQEPERIVVFVHPQGINESNRVGAGTRIWAFAHVLPGAQIGADCNICDHVFIENNVIIGDRVTIKSGVQLWDGARIEDDVFIGPNASFTNDLMPRSKEQLAEHPVTRIAAGASIGAGATILPVTVGRNAMVGAGAVVTRTCRRTRSWWAIRRGSAATSANAPRRGAGRRPPPRTVRAGRGRRR